MLGDLIFPKNPGNRDYSTYVQRVEQGLAETEIIKTEKPTPVLTWDIIRKHRDERLQETDWVVFPDVNPANKQAWVAYRQALRDIPQDFSDPNEVVWPVKPA